MKNDYRVMYLRNIKGQPVGCLVIDVNRNSNTINYQLSVLNPADRFDRRVARQLALGRLMEDPIAIPMSRKDANMHVISAAVMKNLIIRKSTPSRAVKSAKMWVAYSGK